VCVSSLSQLFIFINLFINFIANNISLINYKSSKCLCAGNYFLSNFRFFQCSFTCGNVNLLPLISALHFLNYSSSTLLKLWMTTLLGHQNLPCYYHLIESFLPPNAPLQSNSNLDLIMNLMYPNFFLELFHP
jgi:hypothetical protein